MINNDCLCFCIDMQEKLLPHMQQRDLLLRNHQILLTAMKELNISYFLTEQYPKGLGKTCGLLQNFDALVLEKTSFGIVNDEKIYKKIKNANKKQIVLTGIESHICVLQSALQLKKEGYEVIIPLDCVSSRHVIDMECAKIRFIQQDCVVTSLESLIFAWLKDAKHEKFKRISKLFTTQ